MNIRQKLYVSIPLLVMLMSMVSLYIFESSKSVQESYYLMMDRILLYKQISQETQDNLLYLNRYLLKREEESYPELERHIESLEGLRQKLSQLETNESNDLPIRNYRNMIETFLEQVLTTVELMYQLDSSSNISSYIETEQTARFIGEDGQALVDLELSYYRPIYQNIMQTTRELNRLGIYLVFTVSLLSIVIAVWLSSSISDPIRRLVHTAKQISRGKWDTKAPERKTNDEIGILCQTFNQMLDNIQELMAQNMKSLEKDRLVKELELKALQSQINPHFLFNTLNAIAKLAYIEGAERTSDLTVSVSKLLRYNLQRMDQSVTLRDEVEHVKEYLAIQKARFRDRIRFVTEIDERALDQAVPCLTLQPILENAFVHGIEEIEEGAVLKLGIAYREHEVVVEIADNGAGMEEETLQMLIRSVSEDVKWPGKGKSTGLGTRNVFHRLEFFYGGQQSVEIWSRPGEGTVIRFILPRRLMDGEFMEAGRVPSFGMEPA